MNLKISNEYEKFISSFSNFEKTVPDLNSNLISREIYCQLFKIKLTQWKMRIDFKRLKRHTVSDLFQDIIGFYLNKYLPNNFDVYLEQRKQKLQPDILIYKNQKPHFVIEIKTTIGWNREGPEIHFPPRIKKISDVFSIPQENIVYIFQNPFNAGNEFLNRYYDTENHKPRIERPKEFPYCQIFPLFSGEDPYYWKHENFNRNAEYKEFSDEEIIEFSKKFIVSRFEDILKLILKEKNTAANNG